MQQSPPSSLWNLSIKSPKIRLKASRFLPLGYGLNVNYPYFTNGCKKFSICEEPHRWRRRMPTVAYNVTSGLIIIPGNNYYGTVSAGLNTCYNGNCSLPGESVVVTTCQSAVSIFTIDYDAPSSALIEQVSQKISGWWVRGPPCIKFRKHPNENYLSSTLLCGH